MRCFPSLKNMEVFHVALMRAGKIFDKLWKIQRACINKIYKTSTQYVKLSETSKNVTKFHKTCWIFLENYLRILKKFKKCSGELYKKFHAFYKKFYELYKKFHEFYKKFQKLQNKIPKGNSIFHGTFSISSDRSFSISEW